MAIIPSEVMALMLLPILAQAINYCVLPSRETYHGVCAPAMNPPYNCDEHLILSNRSGLGKLNNDRILFCEGAHRLNAVWTISNSSNLLFFSIQGKAIVTCTVQESGIYFINVTNVTLENLAFKQCGITNSAHMKSYYNRAALVFAHVENLEMSKIFIQEPSTAGGFSLNDMRGKVIIQDSKFKNSRISENETSGNFIGYSTFNVNISTVTIRNSSFENNSYVYKKPCINRDHRLSAGLAIVILVPHVEIVLNNVTFRKNGGCGGGNVAILYKLIYKSGTNLSAHVTITNNTVIHGGVASIGGGILVLMTLRELSNVFSISDTTITSNRAFFNGGGLFIKAVQGLVVEPAVGVSNKKHFNEPSFVNISGCLFEDNTLEHTKSNGGYAFQVTTFFTKGFKPSKRPQLRVNISSSSFIHHGAKDTANGPLKSGDAVLYIKNTPHILVHGINVTDNTCSGMTAIASNVLLSGTVVISNNTAYRGAGILLCSDALIYFKTNAQLNVTDNHAQYTGGGINIESGCTLNNPACFFQLYSTFDNTSMAVVERNTANYAGDNIFGGSIYSCYLIESRHRPQNVFYELFKVPRNSEKHNSSISSTPRKLQILHFQKYWGEMPFVPGKLLPISPGQLLIFTAVIYGQENGTTPGTVHARLNNSKVHMRRGDDIQAKLGLSYLSYRIFSEIKNEYITLTLNVAEGSTNPHQISTTVTLHIVDCPIGLELEQKHTQSACSCTYLKSMLSNHDKKGIRCGISNISYIKYSTELWIGGICETIDCKSPEIMALSIVCPQDYCCNRKILLMLDKHPFINNTLQCAFNRAGVLCGKCTPGRSVILGSSECRSCSNYYLFLLLFFVLAGPILVFVISFLNLTVSSATMNGIIFYANTVQIYSFSIFHIRTAFLKVFISWLNLDFGISTCFFDGMNGFSKALLQFVFPVYLWAIAGTVIWLSKRYKVMVNLFGTNSVQVLATLILLSYTKLIRASTDAIHFTRLLLAKTPGNQTFSLRWSMDGNLKFLEGHHTIIFTIGVFFGLLSLMYTLVLLFIGQLPRISHWPLFSWIYKLKPFFDCYTGPLSKKGRFWVGLLLVARIFLLVAYSVNVSSAEASKMTFTIIVMVILLWLSLVFSKGIYNNHHLNVLEAFSIANLGVLFSGLLCSYHYQLEYLKKAFVLFSLGTAFLLFLVVIVSHIYNKLGCSKISKWIKSWTGSSSRANGRQYSQENSVTSGSLRIPPYDFNEEIESLIEPK